MVGTFVMIKKPRQIVHVTGVKEGNLIDGNLLQITNYCYFLEDVAISSLSDDNFSQEECEELHQRMKSCDKRLTVVDMEEKARILHEDVTKHWIARELVLLQRRIDQANEKGWRRELSEYVEKRGLLRSPEEQSRLVCEVPEIIAEEPEPECVDDDDKRIENDLTVPNPEASEDHQSDEERPIDSPVSGVDKSLEKSENSEEYLRLVPEEPEPECIDEPNPEAYEDHQSDEERPRDSPVSGVDNSLEKSESPEEYSRLLREDPEVVAEELTPEYIDVDDEKIEDDFIIQNPPESVQSDSPDSRDKEGDLNR